MKKNMNKWLSRWWLERQGAWPRAMLSYNTQMFNLRTSYVKSDENNGNVFPFHHLFFLPVNATLLMVKKTEKASSTEQRSTGKAIIFHYGLFVVVFGLSLCCWHMHPHTQTHIVFRAHHFELPKKTRQALVAGV
jgi:hypothetical protein